ncbi:zinc ribbon domain-containing protein [Desulforhopalus singaporensis]|uniref:Zinc ribbon domain-containing protein n=1 Tax=Desulforhopalus singaporensis TaxID=91360 RepID=A0A1H0QHJ6_9BACT|nr:zinc ribbon domain-containing protein [Desulforhopalus singaporensis]SDP16853.1 hypothetical protein SAMN05660330_01970 [Desulforhopalus singaporensis]
MSSILRYLDEVKICPHCKQQLSCCEAPPIHVGDGLGWGSEVLFICLNDNCSVFLDGWEKIETQYGHHASYRYMELPNSKESNYMMVANADAFKACVIDKDVLKAQNKRYQEQKKNIKLLETCVEDKNIVPVVKVVLDESAAKDIRRRAIGYICPINDLSCIDALRNHTFRDPAIEHDVNKAIKVLLDANFKKECPACFEIVKAQAKKCMHCNESF